MAQDEFGNYYAALFETAPTYRRATCTTTLFGHGEPAGVVFPTTDEALYVDEDTGIIWQYYGGAWH